MLRRAGAGFGSLALAALLADEAAAAQPDADSAGAPGASLSGPGPAGDLPVHAGRPVAGRHVRPQAAAERDHGKPSPKAYLGQTRKLLASPWKFQQARRVRPRSERAVSPRRSVCRSAVRDPLDGRRRRQPSRRLPADEHRRAGGHAAEPGRLGDVRPGHREPEPARLHRDRPRALDRGRTPIRRGVSAGGVPGDVRVRPAKPDPQPQE